MAGRAEWADDRASRSDDTPVTPPTEEPGRPGVVTAAMVVWIVLGVLMVGTALLYALSLTSASETGPGWLPVVLVMVLLAAGGVAVVIAARRMGAGSRAARRGLTITGVVLAVVGLVQVTFLGVAGSWFVGFVAGAALLHLPAARNWFAREPR